jgi:benzoyl-CoA 2,3-dioxygenase component B
LADAGIDFELSLPHVGFHRDVGSFKEFNVAPDGQVLSEEEWQANVDQWLPSDEEHAHVGSLMVGQNEPGKVAGWIAPPASGINTKPVDYDYVRL